MLEVRVMRAQGTNAGSADARIYTKLCRAAAGDLFLYGIEMPIDWPGETFWNEATQGIKQNCLG